MKPIPVDETSLPGAMNTTRCNAKPGAPRRRRPRRSGGILAGRNATGATRAARMPLLPRMRSRSLQRLEARAWKNADTGCRPSQPRLLWRASSRPPSPTRLPHRVAPRIGTCWDGRHNQVQRRMAMLARLRIAAHAHNARSMLRTPVQIQFTRPASGWGTRPAAGADRSAWRRGKWRAAHRRTCTIGAPLGQQDRPNSAQADARGCCGHPAPTPRADRQGLRGGHAAIRVQPSSCTLLTPRSKTSSWFTASKYTMLTRLSFLALIRAVGIAAELLEDVAAMGGRMASATLPG